MPGSIHDRISLPQGRICTSQQNIVLADHLQVMREVLGEARTIGQALSDVLDRIVPTEATAAALTKSKFAAAQLDAPSSIDRIGDMHAKLKTGRSLDAHEEKMYHGIAKHFYGLRDTINQTTPALDTTFEQNAALATCCEQLLQMGNRLFDSNKNYLRIATPAR